ncbi:hypothetical protein [Xanthomonas arboricola]|uniref:hypothetical protein n=1 Tax=Xanthomonas arboricola TaxID=56448 RepID=UPI0021581CDB|nr:hypothetical protein [Xanthomonas arboricola]
MEVLHRRVAELCLPHGLPIRLGRLALLPDRQQRTQQIIQRSLAQRIVVILCASEICECVQ